MSYFRLLFMLTTVLCITVQSFYGQEISLEDNIRHKKAVNIQNKAKDYEKAYRMYVENIQIFKSKPTENKAYEELIARSYLNAGNCMLASNQIYSALNNFNEAIEKYNILHKKDVKHFPDSLKIYRRTGDAYYNRSRVFDLYGEFNKAFEDAQIAMKWFEKAGRCQRKILCLNQLANISIGKLDYDKVVHYANLAQKKIDGCNKINSNEKADIFHTLAYGYKGLKEYDTAINNYQEALKYTDNIIDSAKTILNISESYIEKGNIKKAEKYLNWSFRLKRKVYFPANTHFSYTPVYENFGDIAMIENNYKTALNLYNISIDNLKDDPKSETPYIYNKPDLIRVLDLKAQAALKSGNTDLAHRTYADLDNWINEFYKDLSTNESKLTWIARAHDTYAHAIEVALAKNDKEKAFQYAEKAHAVLLWQSLSQQAARSLLSENDKEKMDDLTAKISQADQQYTTGEIQIDALRTLERKRENLEKTFDEKYPEYAQRKYQAEATTVSDIQSKIIDDHTAFIEYYRTDEVLYIFIITKNNIEIIQQNADGLTADISTFVKNISRKNMDVENYHALAHKLYEQLIPSAIHSNDDIKHLVIVPDREIGMLPFAALATQATSGTLNKNTPFLLKKYTTNYLYSAGSYLQLQQKPTNQKYCFAGIAPVEYKMEKWKNKPLPHSEEELDGIKPLHWQWQREILMREQATKAEFERIIREGYRTIQVSTHAVFDKNKGQIIFHDKVITQGDIDQLEINTHRLILSACDTGVGIQNQGEGILSLGWNFAYKGVPSITMTHWSISDNSTKDIMIHYHENLNDSTPADQALQNAQQKYLENIASDTQANPYYWAAFFHTGNTE